MSAKCICSEDRTHSVSLTRSLSFSVCCHYVSGYSGLISYCLVPFFKTHFLSLSLLLYMLYDWPDCGIVSSLLPIGAQQDVLSKMYNADDKRIANYQSWPLINLCV